MTLEQIQEKVNAFLVDELEIDEEKITDGARLKEDLGIDSLEVVDVVVLVDQEFGFKMKPEDFKEDGGLVYIKKNRMKTGVEYVTVLYEDAVEIYKLYGGKIPLISNQKFNKYLQMIAKDAGIGKTVTSLTARHTFATYLLSDKGLSMDIVSKMLGHTSTKQTKTYASMLDSAVLEANREKKPYEARECPIFL